MLHLYKNSHGGLVAMTDAFHQETELMADASLYKFLWVHSGTLRLQVDHVPIALEAGSLLTLTPLHHIDFLQPQSGPQSEPQGGCQTEVPGEPQSGAQNGVPAGAVYTSFLFNREFYCIYDHDREVSCNGFLFYGTNHPMLLTLSPQQTATLAETASLFCRESREADTLQEEMLRIVLKRFIISCTRFARRQMGILPEQEGAFQIIRQYRVLVNRNYKTLKSVAEYAELLHRAPKTLANLFAQCRQPTPLQIIHQRIEAEAKRLLLYTDYQAKEVAQILGFDDASTFSRFFKKMTGQSVTDFKNKAAG